MPDDLTGEEELEVTEGLDALRNAITRMDPIKDANRIAAYQSAIDQTEDIIEGEEPTPLLCPTCNPPSAFTHKCPTCKTVLGDDGYAKDQPAFLLEAPL